RGFGHQHRPCEWDGNGVPAVPLLPPRYDARDAAGVLAHIAHVADPRGGSWHGRVSQPRESELSADAAGRGDARGAYDLHKPRPAGAAPARWRGAVLRAGRCGAAATDPVPAVANGAIAATHTARRALAADLAPVLEPPVAGGRRGWKG